MLAFLAAWPLAGGDGKADPSALATLSLEDLMNVEVTSVTRRSQPLSNSAAAIFVITSEDIRRSAATTVPELLRMVPGLIVARLDGNKWSVSSRGPGGRYVANLLVLIDGRTVYSPLFSGVYWEDHEFVLEDIDRIEVIRGPGAVVWGSNAVSGVINITTKSARKTKGDLVSATAGNLNQGVVQMRHGGDLGDSGAYRIFGRMGRYGDLVDSSGHPVHDGYSTNMGGFRMDLDQGPDTHWMMEGSLQTGTVDQRDLSPSLVTGNTAIVDSSGEVSAGHVLTRWSRDRADGGETRVQLYYDWYDRKPFLSEERQTVDLDISHSLQLGGRHTLIAGGGYRESWDSIPVTPRISLLPPRESMGLANFYLQDQIRLGETTSFSVGARTEYSPPSGASFQPAVQFLWTPGSRHSVWASVSRALRMPSRGEEGFDLLFSVLPTSVTGAPLPLSVTALGERQMQPEKLISYEAGYRNQVSRRLSLDLATYYYDYQDLRAFVSSGVPSLVFDPAPHLNIDILMVNGRRAHIWGGELSMNYSVSDRWRLSGSYSRLSQRQELDPGVWNGGMGALPQALATLRSQTDLTRKLLWDTDVCFTGRLFDPGVPLSPLALIQPSGNPGQVIRLDTRLTWRVSRAWDLTAGGENLLQPRHLEMVPEAILVGSQVPRSWLVRLNWRH